LVLPLMFDNEVVRRDFFSKVMPWVTLFNISYITLVAIFGIIKKKRLQEKAR
jgi:hypothetical protein